MSTISIATGTDWTGEDAEKTGLENTGELPQPECLGGDDLLTILASFPDDFLSGERGNQEQIGRDLTP